MSGDFITSNITLRDLLIVGSYLFSATTWLILWRAIIRTHEAIDLLRMELARKNGLAQGQDHEQRLTRLERAQGG